MTGPYRIELDRDGCSECGHGRGWYIVGPDDIAGSTIYGDQEDAQNHADDLNVAYAAGQEAMRERAAVECDVCCCMDGSKPESAEHSAYCPFSIAKCIRALEIEP